MNTASSSGSRTLPSNTITNPKEDLKGITTRSGIAYKGPTIPTTSSPPKVVERETKVTKDTMSPTNNGSTKDVQPSVVQIETQVPNYEPVVAPVVEPVEVSPPLAKLRTYMLREPIIKVVILTKLKETLKNMFGQFKKVNTASSSSSGTLPSNTITNPKEDFKGITTQSGIAYKGPTIPTTSSPTKVVERKTKVTKDTVPPANNGSTKDIQPLVVQVETQVPNSEPVVAPVIEPAEAPVSTSRPNPKPSIPYPSRLNDQKLREKANDQMEKYFQIFQYLNFNISFTDALILMPKFASTIKSLLTNKDKLFELARAPLNEHYSAVLLKKLTDKLGDPDKFLIPCDFSGMDESFLKTEHALIDVYKRELTLRVGNKDVTFNLDQTSRYFAKYDVESIIRIDVIHVACEEYSQEVLRFPGDILLREEFINDDPLSPPLPPQELKVVEPKNEKSSIDEPLVVELKDLPPHLEYAKLESNDKLPVIIAKDLKDAEKIALIKVLKSHKQALAWQLSDIKGI
nr:reverse transcriptase domain-containing protein [Tanacetum cinerariifolium]